MKKRVFFGLAVTVTGLIGVFMLYKLYLSEMKTGSGDAFRYSGRIAGPLEGRLKYINIISSKRPDCLDYGFYLYFTGTENEDFVVVTPSVRDSFGNLSENIIGYRFRFEKLMECRKGIENARTFLPVSPPVMLGDE